MLDFDNDTYDYCDDDSASTFSFDSVESTEASDALYEEVNPEKILIPTVVNFKPWQISDYVYKQYIKLAEKLEATQLPTLSRDQILIMLQKNRWQADELVNEFYDNKEALLKSCGLVESPKNTFLSKKDFDCPICCETYDEVITYSLSCKHEYCVNCYHNYINASIPNGQLITCITPDCTLTIPHIDLDNIAQKANFDPSVIQVTPDIINNKLLAGSAKIHIDSTPNFCWCPGLDCDKFVELYGEVPPPAEENSNLLEKITIIKCPSSHEFCFHCKFENHLPNPCWIVKLWLKKCKDDSETANWIDSNTKPCPNCDNNIEKNGGCNHMSCSTCRKQFCWICLKDINKHSTGNCNSYVKPEMAKKRDQSRANLHRYLHFYKRFNIHETSSRGDLRTINQIECLANQYMEDNREVAKLSWADIQYLPDAIKALIVGRKTLKWTYCFGYYLGENNFTKIFEGNQNLLNETVEGLSKIFEEINDKKNLNKMQTIVKRKSDIINLTKTIHTRRKLLFTGCNADLKSNLLKFEL